jgi:predicted 3-demethylubiquinone-9 3-methyltransferase (glyoxalase superfamily)
LSTMQPFLMFQGGHAEQAMTLYVSLFDDGEILDVMRWQKGEQGAEGSIKLARFRAAGQCVLTSDSPVKHAFDLPHTLLVLLRRLRVGRGAGAALRRIVGRRQDADAAG